MKLGRYEKPFLLGALVASSILNVVLARDPAPSAGPGATTLTVGETFPKVRLRDGDGGSAEFGLGQGAFVMYVTSPMCTACLDSIRAIQAMIASDALEYRLVTVLPDTPEVLRMARERADVEPPIFGDAVAMAELKTETLPQVFVVDATGRLRAIWTGATMRVTTAELLDYLARELQSVSQGQ